jgi:orotate phosphoribosyltransferase-like protein
MGNGTTMDSELNGSEPRIKSDLNVFMNATWLVQLLLHYVWRSYVSEVHVSNISLNWTSLCNAAGRVSCLWALLHDFQLTESKVASYSYYIMSGGNEHVLKQ